MSEGRETREAQTALSLVVNGRRQRVRVPPMKRLLDVLRDDCGLTGTKEGCGEGECGACTVLLDGRTVNSCLVPAVQADGANVVTVEGLGTGARLSALQRAFVEMGGAQCGICTPGMLLSAHELLARKPGRTPTDPEVREALAGNLCRCTGYQKIVDAVQAAARAGRAAGRAKTTRAKATRAKTTRAKATRAKATRAKATRAKTRRTKAKPVARAKGRRSRPRR